MTTTAAIFTAAKLAAHLGKTPQAVRRMLRDVPASGVVIVSGNQTAAWAFDDLPERLQLNLHTEAGRRGYRNAQAMLAAPPAEPWPPTINGKPVRLIELHQSCIDAAVKLQRALAPSIARLHDLDLNRDAFDRAGCEDYRREFGHCISTRYFRALLKRTLDRDAGAEDYGRLEIYLPERLARKQTPATVISDALSDQFAELTEHLAACANPVQPTAAELRGIWQLAFAAHDRLRGQGLNSRDAGRRVRDFLCARCPFLAPSRQALLMAFNRRLARYLESNRDANALKDRRESNGAHFDLPDDDRDLLIHRAVFSHRGSVAPAWRDLLKEGFSEVTRTRYAGKARSKSDVPRQILDDIAPEIEVLAVMAQGPHAFDTIKGHVNRNYEGIASLQCMMADDFTLNSYVYVPDGKGWFHLTRGQTLIFIDFRSLKILGWSFEPRASYSSLSVRGLCTHVFAEYGVPQVLYFERGLWKSATLLTGQKRGRFDTTDYAGHVRDGALGFAEISQGLREFGIRFIHAIRPRSKTVEKVGGIIQDLLNGEPGYSGRDERHDAPESLRKQIAAVQTRKNHPSEFFYSADQWNQRLREVFTHYNETPQEGRVLAGLSPDAAFEQYLNRDNPQQQFGAIFRALLAHDKRPAQVTLNGITIQIGKQKFNYRGRQIAHLVGRQVMAWFNPEEPEILTVTNMDRTNPICVMRSQEPNALEALVDPDSRTLAAEMARINEQASFMKTRFNVIRAKFELPQKKRLADAQRNANLCYSITAQKNKLRADTAKESRQRTQRRKAERRLGLTTNPKARLRETSNDSLRALSGLLEDDNERAEP